MMSLGVFDFPNDGKAVLILDLFFFNREGDHGDKLGRPFEGNL